MYASERESERKTQLQQLSWLISQQVGKEDTCYGWESRTCGLSLETESSYLDEAYKHFINQGLL